MCGRFGRDDSIAEEGEYVDCQRCLKLHMDMQAQWKDQPVELANDTQVGGDHYKSLAVQPWDALESWLTPEEFRGFLKGTAIYYMLRAGKKGDALEDIEKAVHTGQKLAEVMQK